MRCPTSRSPRRATSRGTEKVASPRQDEVDRFHAAMEAGMDYDVMANQLVDPATGERTDLKTGAKVEA